MKKNLSLKKLTIANLTHAELTQLQGGNTFTFYEVANCDADHAYGQKIQQAGTIENSCESGLRRCW